MLGDVLQSPMQQPPFPKGLRISGMFPCPSLPVHPQGGFFSIPSVATKNRLEFPESPQSPFRLSEPGPHALQAAVKSRSVGAVVI